MERHATDAASPATSRVTAPRTPQLAAAVVAVVVAVPAAARRLSATRYYPIYGLRSCRLGMTD